MNIDMEDVRKNSIPETPREREIFERGKEELQHEGFNKYASHKSVSQNLLNTSIIQSHIGTLVYILSNKTGENGGFEIAAIALISVSLTLQIVIFFALTWLVYKRQDYSSTFISSVGINVFVTCVSGISLMINISITAVSLEIRP